MKQRVRTIRPSLQLAFTVLGLAFVMYSSVRIARADHYGFWGSYYNSYVIGWNTETGFNSGQVFAGCDGAHWRHFARLSIYGYQSYDGPYINWIQLYDGTTINSNVWIYGTSYLISNEESIVIDSWWDSFYSSNYYFVFDTIQGDGHVALYVPKGSDPVGMCATGGYFLYERVG